MIIEYLASALPDIELDILIEREYLLDVLLTVLLMLLD